MQLRVVQDDEAGVVEEVGPHVVVARGVSQLKDRQVVGLPALLPDEIVRVEDLGFAGKRRAVDEDLDGLVPLPQQRQNFRRVRSNPRSAGRERRKPRDVASAVQLYMVGLN